MKTNASRDSGSALSLQGIEARSVCGVPLTTPHRRIGVLGIASLQVNAYSEEDQHFLSFWQNTWHWQLTMRSMQMRYESPG